jgi:hypothetical protein
MLCRPHLARRGRSIATLCRARIRRASGDQEGAIALLRTAVEMHGFGYDVERARYALGLMIGGDEGAALRSQCEHRLRERGAANPVKLMGFSFPELL